MRRIEATHEQLLDFDTQQRLEVRRHQHDKPLPSYRTRRQ